MIYLLLITFILAPAYVIKLNVFNLPLNLLMVWVFLLWLIFGVWLVVNNRVRDFTNFKPSVNKKVLLAVGLFFLAGLISMFIGRADRAKLGQFIVLFLQPISLFFIGAYIFSKYPKTKNYLLAAIYSLLAVAGLYAILQYFALIGLPTAWWGNSVEPKRAISFFVHPNFYALWCTPLLAFLIPDVFANLKSSILNLKSFAWLLGAAGLLLSLSRAGWLGLAAIILVYLIFAANAKIRKTVFAAVVVIIIVIVSVPNLRWRFILPFYGEKSSVSRLSLWQTGIKGIKESPVLGLGLTGFSRQWTTLNTDPGLTDTHNFPHNIFLDLWVETGLIGLISLTGLIGLYIYRGLKNRQDLIKLGVSLFLIALLVQGQIDNPYFKNDLAMVFWIILALG
jgi:O-antigen ligase